MIESMKALKAVCWMFAIPALVCAALLAWYAVDRARPLEVGEQRRIEAGTFVAWSERELRGAESYIVADDDWGRRELFRLAVSENKGGFTDLRENMPATIVAISADRRVAEIQILGGAKWRAFTFVDRLR